MLEARGIEEPSLRALAGAMEEVEHAWRVDALIDGLAEAGEEAKKKA